MVKWPDERFYFQLYPFDFKPDIDEDKKSFKKMKIFIDWNIMRDTFSAMTTTQTTVTEYHISISANDTWAGDGKLDVTSFAGGNVSATIRDCAAVLGGSQDAAEEIYAAIEDAISNMEVAGDSSLDFGGAIYAWTISEI